MLQIFYNVLSSDGTRGDSLSKVSETAECMQRNTRLGSNL